MTIDCAAVSFLISVNLQRNVRYSFVKLKQESKITGIWLSNVSISAKYYFGIEIFTLFNEKNLRLNNTKIAIRKVFAASICNRHAQIMKHCIL